MHLKKHEELIVNHYCSYRLSPSRGLGVFARRPIAVGTVILQDLCLLIDSIDAKVVSNTSLRDHLFADREQNIKKSHETCLYLAFGASSVLNHSDNENCHLDWKTNQRFPHVLTVTTGIIEENAELFIRYADLDTYGRVHFV